MSNPFKVIGTFFQKLVLRVLSPAGRKQLADALAHVQDLITPALHACEVIATLTPSRSDDEIIALANKYALGTLTPEMLSNDAILSGILKHAAMVELQHLTGTSADPRVLDMAIQSAYLVYKQASHDVGHAEMQEANGKSAS